MPRDGEAFPDFEQIRRAVSWRDAQFSGILCSILLSYVDLGRTTSLTRRYRLIKAAYGSTEGWTASAVSARRTQ